METLNIRQINAKLIQFAILFLNVFNEECHWLENSNDSTRLNLYNRRTVRLKQCIVLSFMHKKAALVQFCTSPGNTGATPKHDTPFDSF